MPCLCYIYPLGSNAPNLIDSLKKKTQFHVARDVGMLSCGTTPAIKGVLSILWVHNKDSDVQFQQGRIVLNKNVPYVIMVARAVNGGPAVGKCYAYLSSLRIMRILDYLV